MKNMRRWLAILGFVTIFFFGFFAFDAAEATVILNFSDYSSDDTPASVLTATASFTVSGTQLLIDINNTSAYSIAQLYFNSDTTLTGLSFASSVNPAWSIAGTGLSQGKNADGFGNYNWLIDFGSGANRLGSGLTLLTLNMTGTTSETTIESKLSIIPPGAIRGLGAMKFEAGPGGDSAFGATVTVPEPRILILLGIGMTAVGIASRRMRKI